MTILITGGAGFIGSRLALALRQRHERIVILDNFNDFYDPALKRANVATLANDPDVEIIEGDIRDAALVDRLMQEHGITKIAHLAGMANVRKSIEDPRLYYDVNVIGSLTLMEAAKKYAIAQFVQASTSSVYGETNQVPFVESDAADRPLSPYPASKRAAEILGHSYFHLYGLNVTCLRFFNVYGPNGRPDMMPLRVTEALVKGTPITIFNKGEIHRDWTYIDDTVSGIIAALNTPLGYEVLNLGLGSPVSLNAFVDILEELTSRTLQRIDVPTPPSEPPITYCDNTRARTLLGFAPKVPLTEGLAHTWTWYRERYHAR